MKKIILCLTIFTSIAFACQQTGNKTKPAIDTVGPKKPAVVGSDKDPHNCIASAGYTWSAIKNDCVKVWEAGVTLNAVDDTAAAYVIFNADLSKAELFLPKLETVMLARTGEEGNYIWTDGKYELFSWKGYTLRIKGGEPLYNGDQN